MFPCSCLALASRFEASALYDLLREFLAPGRIRSLDLGCVGPLFVRVPAALRSFGRLVE